METWQTWIDRSRSQAHIVCLYVSSLRLLNVVPVPVSLEAGGGIPCRPNPADRLLVFRKNSWKHEMTVKVDQCHWVWPVAVPGLDQGATPPNTLFVQLPPVFPPTTYYCDGRHNVQLALGGPPPPRFFWLEPPLGMADFSRPSFLPIAVSFEALAMGVPLRPRA